MPVVPTPLSDVERLLTAVGLGPSPASSPSPTIAIMTPPDEPQSVADIATITPSPQDDEYDGQDISSTPPSFAPSPSPAPPLV